MFNTVSSSACHVLPPPRGQTRPVGFGSNSDSTHSSSVQFGVGPSRSRRREKPNNQVSIWQPLLTRKTFLKGIGTGALVSGSGAAGYMVSRDNDQLDITGQNKRSTPQKALLATQYASLLAVCGGLSTAILYSIKLCNSMIAKPNNNRERVQQLVKAAETGDLNKVKSLVGSYVNVNGVHVDTDKPDPKDWTPLRAAASQGHLPVIEFLLSAGANVNQATVFGQTPLWMAAKYKHFSSFQKLVDAGADVNKSAHTTQGGTPLWVVAAFGETHPKSTWMTESLIRAGADLNKVNPVDGTTPMQAASRAGHTQIVELLRKHGARDVDAEIAAQKAQEAREAREAARKAQEAREARAARRREKQPQQSFQMQAQSQQRELQQYPQQQQQQRGNQDEYKFLKKLAKKVAIRTVSHMVGVELDSLFS